MSIFGFLAHEEAPGGRQKKWDAVAERRPEQGIDRSVWRLTSGTGPRPLPLVNSTPPRSFLTASLLGFLLPGRGSCRLCFRRSRCHTYDARSLPALVSRKPHLGNHVAPRAVGRNAIPFPCFHLS